ncbi:MipA/OmpV family protein [Xylophilus sp. GW821-FHT01B05]
MSPLFPAFSGLANKPLQRRLRAFIVPTAVGCALLTAVQAQAQESTKAESPSVFGDQTSVTLGLGVRAGPRYMGSKDSVAMPVPVVSISRGIFFADSMRGLGAEYSSDSGLYVSTALNYDFGRAEKDSDWRPGSDKLRGMGAVKGAATANLLVAQQIVPWLSVNAEAVIRLADAQERGNRYRLGLTGTVLQNQSDVVTLGANVHAGDRRYNQTYFGVTQAQSARTAFSPFQADAGVYGYSLTADWKHDFDKHWSMYMAVSVMELGEKAKNSPLVSEKTGVTALAAVGYKF